MEKELAIEVEAKEVFKEKYAWNIMKCNLDFIDYRFEDKELKVVIERFGDNNLGESYTIAIYDDFYIKSYDDRLISKNDIDRLLAKIEEINKKYTRINGPRVKKGDVYFYLNDILEVNQQIDAYQKQDFERYRIGNYFRNFNEAKKAAKPFKEFWYKITYGDNNGNS